MTLVSLSSLTEDLALMTQRDRPVKAWACSGHLEDVADVRQEVADDDVGQRLGRGIACMRHRASSMHTGHEEHDTSWCCLLPAAGVFPQSPLPASTHPSRKPSSGFLFQMR